MTLALNSSEIIALYLGIFIALVIPYYSNLKYSKLFFQLLASTRVLELEFFIEFIMTEFDRNKVRLGFNVIYETMPPYLQILDPEGHLQSVI